MNTSINTYQYIDIFNSIGDLYSARTAIIEYKTGSKYSYGELAYRASRIAGYLSDLSLGEGDRIAALLMNRVEYIDLFLAARKLGSILVPLNWRLTSYELRAVIRDIEPKVVVYEERFRGLIEEAVKGEQGSRIYRVVVNGEPNSSEYYYGEAFKSRPLNTKRHVRYEEPAMILYTGGTTGIPKGAVITYRQIFYNVFSEILTWRLRDSHRTVTFLPLFHTGGWNLLTLPLLARGGLVYMIEKFDPHLALEVIEAAGSPLVIFGVPTMYYMMAKSSRFKESSLENVEWMISGGAPIDRKVMEEYWSKKVKIAQGYGMTEGGPNNLTMPVHDLSIEEIKARWKSVGKPFVFNEIKVVDQDGRGLGPNVYGEIVICGPVIFSGYWKRVEETAAVLKNGCVYTGDIGYYDDDGYFYIVDRKKDIIKSGGEQIYPREIEELILQHPSVEDCAVIGVPDEKWGEVPKLIIKLRPSHMITKEEIIRFLEGKVARYKMPKYVAIVDEIPKSPAGKTLKRVLIEKHGTPADEL